MTSQMEEKLVDVSIIIVNYNVREYLRQSLLSLRSALAELLAQNPAAAEIFVVDNASGDGSVEMVRREFPEVKLIVNHENLGFAAANNQALRQARGRLVVLLNPDTVVQEDTFTAIRDFMERHPDAGMVGCKVLNPDGSLQLACRRSFPTPWVAFTRLSGLSQLFPKSRWFGRYNLTYLPEDETVEVEAISGSFMAVRREALAQVGMLDEDFFLYGEDLDWCFRMRTAGWKIYYFPGTQIIHFKGESARHSSLDNLRLFYQAMSQFVRKHFQKHSDGRPLFLVSYWLLHLAIWMRAAIAFVESIARKLAVPMTDLALMQLSMLAAIWLRFGRVDFFPKFLIVDIVYSFIWLVCLALFGCYRRSTYSSYQAFVATTIGFFINASLTYFFKQYAFSRAVVLIAGVMNIVLLATWRLAVKVLHHLGLGPFKGPLGKTLLGQRTVIVGDFVSDGALVEKLKTNIDSSYDLIGLVSLEASEVGKFYAGLPVLTSLDQLDEWLKSPGQSGRRVIRGNRVQQVIFSTQRIPFGKILEVMSQQRQHRLSFKLVPSHLDVIIGKSGIDQVTEVPLLEIENRLSRFWPAFTKRLFDVILAGFFLLLSAPLILITWMFLGKLRARVVQTPDARTIRLWQFSAGGRLAKWPWLLTILSGKLSWVGLAIPPEGEQASRCPGIELPLGVTGLAQINRPSGYAGQGSPRPTQLTQEEQNKLYLYYVTHYSPLLDLEILFRKLFRI
ncbi:MAG: glycosyltransferase [candidate division KSB1 bacterium]|nr:glycosyltransferase [candidate division KSB1 bacterium]